MTTTPPWKKLKLPLERPYKNDKGSLLPVLLDITPEGQFLYEPQDDPEDTLGARLRRVFEERGIDYWDRDSTLPKSDENATELDEEEPDTHQGMTPAELQKMRMELIPHLHTALGEMSHARDLLSLLLGSQTESNLNDPLPPSSLTTSHTSLPTSIPSVSAFNAHLTIGSKDASFRLAAGLFSEAATSAEKTRKENEIYWRDALSLRSENWALVPAPLDYGARGAAKDFLVSYGLEQSPSHIRRKTIARMASSSLSSAGLVFPHRTHTLLRVAMITSSGTLRSSAPIPTTSTPTASDELRSAQAESVSLEAFSLLAREATALPSAAARVSERVVAVSPSRGVELVFELLPISQFSPEDKEGDPLCDLIVASLPLLLLRAHSANKAMRQAANPNPSWAQIPKVLQPLLDLLHYRSFSMRVWTMLDGILDGLRKAGVDAKMRWKTVGEDAEAVLDAILSSASSSSTTIGGEAILKIENERIRLVIQSPAVLHLHLPHVSLKLEGAVGRCESLIRSEIVSALSSRIVESQSKGKGWFVDAVSGRGVRRWEGGALSFRVWCEGEDELIVRCESAYVSKKGTKITQYEEGCSTGLVDWTKSIADSVDE